MKSIVECIRREIFSQGIEHRFRSSIKMVCKFNEAIIYVMTDTVFCTKKAFTMITLQETSHGSYNSI